MEIPLDQITVEEDRQRKTLADIEGLVESIKRIGLLHPIVLDKTNRLLAGRRRLEAYRRLGHSSIPARYFESLDAAERKLVELDENLRRVDLPWQERAHAVAQLKALRGEETIRETAEFIGMSEQNFGQYLLVAAALKANDPRISACTNLRQAAELLLRRKRLEFDTAFAELEDQNEENFEEPGNETAGVPKEISISGSLANGDLVPFRKTDFEISAKHQILQGDFFSFAPFYSGSKFNFVHCDFPYGINFDRSDAAATDTHDSHYSDSPELFWGLTEALLQNKDRLFSSSAHLLFWFHMRYYGKLIERLSSAGFFVHELPLIWHKSDGMGIASDYRRRPKHVYETALWASLGDRPLSLLKNDVFPAPIAKKDEDHVSAKPEGMLRYFLSMGVNDLSSFFDPTCGSGTSIRAAAALGADRSLGLELNADVARSAQLKLRDFLKKEEEEKD